MLFALPSTRASRNMKGIFTKAKLKQMEADEEQQYEHKDETDENFSLFNVTYKNMLAMVVCDVQKIECMVHKCPHTQCLAKSAGSHINLHYL